MNRLSLIIIAILLFLLAGSWIFIGVNGSADKKEYISPVAKTDTVYKIKEKIKIITVQAPTPPAKVIIQTIRDTVYRKQVEKENIIIGESLENNKLHVQTIDTLGQVKDAIIDIPKDTEGVKIDGQGHVEIKKRKKLRAWVDRSAKHIRNGLAVVGAGAIIIVVSIVASGG